MTIPNAAAKALLSPEQLDVVAKIVQKFLELGIDASFVPPVVCGPVVSLYKFKPEGRTRVSHLEGLSADFAVTLGVEDVIVKRRTGDTAVSIAVPNKERKFVDFRDSINMAMHVMSKLQSGKEIKIPINLGVDEFGMPLVEDLTTMPHLLIAGSTGAGKSVLLNSILGTIVYTMNSRSIQLVLSDTKAVEFNHLRGLPHLAFPPAQSVYQTLERMSWLIDVVEERLRIIGGANKQNVAQYNDIARAIGGNPLPYMVLVIDELADLMVNSKGEKRNESKIAKDMLAKIVQKSRAAGVHVIAATQRSSVKVIDGDIKANFPTRLSLKLPSHADSMTILGTSGAEHLLVPGDMLYLSNTRSSLTRAHSPWAKLEDVAAAVEYAKAREAGVAR